MTARTPLADLSKLGTLPDDELERARAVAMAALTPRQLAFVEGKLAGKTSTEAAEAAGYSRAHAKRIGFRVVKGRGVAEAIALGREAANRRAALTIEDVRFRFQAIYRASLAAGDLTNANRALEQLARLGGLYPEQAFRLTVARDAADMREATPEELEILARVVHEQKALPSARAVVEVEPVHDQEEAPDAA